MLPLFASSVYVKDRGPVRSLNPRALRTFVVPSLFLFLFCFASALGQDLDETRRDRAPAQGTLVWENVTRDLQWIGGVRPRKSIRYQRHIVTLKPGQCTEFFVPAHELIRVAPCGEQSLEQALEIWTGNGSGIYRKQVAALSAHDGSLVAAPDQSSTSIARIVRPAEMQSPVSFAVFTSRHTRPQLLDYYRCQIAGSARAVEISNDQDSRIRRYNVIQPGQRHPIAITQSARLRFESRLHYEGDDSRRQTYWIKVFVDGALERIISLDTLPQTRNRVFVDGCEKLVGRREFAYVDLDCGGAQVEFETSHPVYLRVDGVGLDLCRPNLNRSFNFPDWDNSPKALSLWDAPQFDPNSIALSQSFLDEQQPSASIRPDWSPYLDPYLNHQSVQYLARNNEIPHGGLRAYMWMRAMATQHYRDADYGDEISVPELAARIRERYTFYRDLSPTRLDPDSDPSTISFLPSKLRSPREMASETIIGEQHVAEAVRSTPSAFTVRCGRGPLDALQYPVPDGLNASLIRLVVNQSLMKADARLMIRYDDGTPIEINVQREQPLTPELYIPSRSAAGIAGLSHLYPRYDGGVDGGPFNTAHRPINLVRAATAEFMKPAGVSRIYVWVESDTETLPHIGLQYLDAREVKLSEAAILYLKKLEQSDHPLLARFAQQELANETIRTQRTIEAHVKRFSSSVSRSAQIEAPKRLWDTQTLQHMTIEAMAHAAQQQWTAAIETLSDIINHSTGRARQQAIIARTQAMESAGEFYLADRERRGWFLFSDDIQLKRAMLDQLLKQAGDDPLAREMFAAVAAIEIPTPEFELRLAQELMNGGKFRAALHVMSSWDANDDNRNLLLRCSYQLKWWRLFDETIRSISDPQQKHFWQALKSLHQGNDRRAHRLFAASGDFGRDWIDHWEQGHAVFTALCDADSEKRLSAIDQWEQWQATAPGPRQWKTEDNAVQHASGKASVLAQSTQHRAAYFVSQPGQDSEIQLYGPLRIKIEARPIHADGSTDKLQDWLTIRNGVQTERIPISNNYASQSLRLDGDPRVPGMLETVILDLPAGLNRIGLHTDHAPLLFRVLSERPELALPVLPFVNRSTLASVILGRFGPSTHPAAVNKRCRDCVRLVCRDQECCSVAMNFSRLTESTATLQSANNYFDQLKFGDVKHVQNRLLAQDAPFVVVGGDAQTQDAYRMVYQPSGGLSGEDADNQRMLKIAKLESIVADNPGNRELISLLKRLRSGTTWEPYRQFDSRAGVYSEALSGWNPETPAVRIRKSLMDPELTGSHVLSSGRQFTLSTDESSESHYVLSLQRPAVGFVPLTTTNVVTSLSGDQQTISLEDSFSPSEFNATLASEQQSIQVIHDSPLANHFVAVGLAKMDSDNQERIESFIANDFERTYQVATVDEPIQFAVAAPCLLRIDKRVGKQTYSQIVPAVEDRLFELGATEGEQAKYRIFQLTLQNEAPPAYRPQWAEEEPVEQWADGVVQAAYHEVDAVESTQEIAQLSVRSPDADPIIVDLDQTLPMQNMGTLGFEFGFQRRRALEEFPIAAAPDQFFDVRLSRRYYDQWREFFTTNELLIRPRLGSGPTFGFAHETSAELPARIFANDRRADGWGNPVLGWKGHVFNQRAGTPLVADANSSPWIVGFSANISRNHQLNSRWSHRPTLSFFGRALSENQNGFAPGELDQDIFTQYKSDHPLGFIYSDRFVMQNCLDRRWWIRPRVVSNADELTPDNLGFQVGTDQLLGPLQLKLSYRLTGYLADNDRRDSSVQNVFYMDMMYERWSSSNRRSELRFRLRNDLGDGSTSIGLSLSTFLNQHRDYRDFQPNSLLFRSVRRERAAKNYILKQ